MIKTASVAAVMMFAAACVKAPYQRANAMSAEPVETPAEDHISLHWKFETADRRMEVTPQEFASPLVYADTLYLGSSSGWFFALRATNGTVRWKHQIGSVASSPVLGPGGLLLVGTSDGMMHALDAQTGDEKWKYQARGPISQPPVIAGELVVFANEADQVVALEAISGKYKWNYKTETPENFTLRGHAGVLVEGDTLYTGFSNGTLVALRKDTGSVAWSTSLKADADKFVDVDSTPIIIGDKIYATSSSSGIFALDKATGQIRWRVPFYDAAQPSETGNVGGMATDGKIIYVSVAELGTYAVDLGGNVVWRVGAKAGGEPAVPTVWNELLIYSLANEGMFLADRKTGETVEYFDPGDGVSAPPAIADGRLYVMSNRGILYAFDLE
jgi:outer membrane protein assembly factor BamB